MTKQSANTVKFSTLILSIYLGTIQYTYSAETENLTYKTHAYTSYAEFADAICQPCHYRNIPNGTDLYPLFHNATESEIKNILEPFLKNGNMPPDEAYRKILYDKFLQMK